MALYQSLAPGYENVHRGQSSASRQMTALFEESYDTIAQFIGAPGRASIALYRNTTEAINAVMYSLLTEFRDGDNVVTTMMEHNSNYVPWHAMCREILPRLGRRVECRLARFDPGTGELDLDHLGTLVDARIKLVCCTGASNFLGTRIPLAAVRALADASGYPQPGGERRSHLLVDAAQLVPGSFVDVQGLRILLDLALSPDRPAYFGTARPLGRAAVQVAMDRICGWNRQLTSRALDGLAAQHPGRSRPGGGGGGRRRRRDLRTRAGKAGAMPGASAKRRSRSAKCRAGWAKRTHSAP